MSGHPLVLTATCLAIASAPSLTGTGNDLRVLDAVKNLLHPQAVQDSGEVRM